MGSPGIGGSITKPRRRLLRQHDAARTRRSGYSLIFAPCDPEGDSMQLHRPLVALALGATLLAARPSQADELHYNQVSLHAEVSSEVARDRMQVTLYSEAQDHDPARLASGITDTLNASLERSRQVKGVTVALGNRNSYPVYEENGQKITGWRERAELRLESGDFAALSQLTADLLGSMKMGGMNFSVSDALRQQNEDALLKDAVTAFRARAQLATQALGGHGYRIVSLNLNGSGVAPAPMRAFSLKAARSDTVPAQDIEAGTSQITMSADGVIEVQIP
jgi:predicted secreted protein